VLAIRYGVDRTLPFAGPPLALLEPTAIIAEAWLTIKREWAAPLDEAGPEPPALQLQIDATAQPQGQVTEPGDDFGGWALEFNLTATETAVDLAPEETATGTPRRLYYDVTLLLADGRTLRPIVGAIRMLPDVFAQVET
jgi:hypothetical protein